MLNNSGFVYISIFSLSLILYSFGWVGIYPDLEYGVIFFFLITFIFSLFFVFVFVKDKNYSNKLRQDGFFLELFYIFGFLFEFVYLGVVPFIWILFGYEFDYSKFGVPVLHVLIVTYMSAVGLIRFYNFLINGGWRGFVKSFLPIVVFIIIYNRGAVVMQLLTYFFVFVSVKKINIRTILIFPPLLLLGFYIFGVLGDLRSGPEIMELTLQPTEKFYALGIPKEFLWAYSYITSPLSNFQYTISNIDCNFFHTRCSDFKGLLISEFIPDVIGKRLAELFNVDFQIDTPLVIDNLNVSTTFSRAYAYYGWVGVYLMFFWIFLFGKAVERFFNKTSMFIPAKSVICCIVAFSFFSNMMSFSGVILQLFWLFVFSKIKRLN